MAAATASHFRTAPAGHSLKDWFGEDVCTRTARRVLPTVAVRVSRALVLAMTAFRKSSTAPFVATSWALAPHASITKHTIKIGRYSCESSFGITGRQRYWS